MTDTNVRRARADDISGLATMLSQAFANEAFHQWLFSDQPDPLRKADKLFARELRNTLRDGAVFTNDNCEAACLWGLPGKPGGKWLSQATMLLTLVQLLGWRTRQVMSELSAVARHRPHCPHWYLSVIGTDPACQHRGIGSALLSGSLAECDAMGSGAWLETASAANTGFYQRFGFVARSRVTLTDGPQIIGMWREPRY